MNLLIVSSVGGGKTICAEELVDFYHRNGYTIISLSDVKEGLEFGFSAFDPEAKYHTDKLRKFGCPRGKIPTKLYHPFTFNIPRNTRLPDINVFTINIKELNRVDLGYLSESGENKRSIQIILETLDKMGRDDGLHHLIFHAEGQTESIANLTKGGVKYRSDNPDDFFTKSKIGTEKTAGEMSAYFRPFLKDYALAPQNCKFNINIRELINDQKHYHIFTYRWIRDGRLKAFFILHLLQEIIANESYAKHPILIYFEEIRFLTPNENDGFKPFLAQELKNTMSRFRNMGRGFGIISTTQVYGGVHRDVVDSFNEVILGRIASFKEIEFIGKALKLTTQDVNLLKSLSVGEFVIKTKDQYSDEPELSKVKFYMPPHAHKEGGYSFFEWYAKKYPHLLRQYNEELDFMQNLNQTIIDKVSVLKDKENLLKRDSVKQDKDEKLQKEKFRMKMQMQKLQKNTEKAEEVDEKMKELIYQEWSNATGRDKSNRAIAKKFNILLRNGEPNHVAVQRAISYIRRKKEKNNPSNDKSDDNQIDPDQFDSQELYDDNENKNDG